MKFTNKNTLFLLFFLLIIIFLYTRKVNSYAFITPDETVNLTYIKTFKNNNELYYKEELLKLGRLKIYKPRGTLSFENNKVFSKKFIGFPFFAGIILKPFPDSFIPYFIPTISFLSLFVIYKISVFLEISKPDYSIYLLALLPPFYYWTNMSLFENILGTFFFSTGFLFLIKGLKKKMNLRTKNFITSSFLFSCGLFVRPDHILLLSPLIIIPFIYKIKFKDILIVIFVSLLTLSPFFYFNSIFYGHPLSTGQSSVKAGQSVIKKGGNSFIQIYENVQSIIISSKYYFILLLIGLIYLVNNFKKISKLKKTYFSFILISTFLFSSFWLSGVPLKRNNFLHESYTRYFLPLYILLIPIVNLTIIKIFKRSYYRKIITFLILLSSFLYTNNILTNVYLVEKKYKLFANTIFQETPKNSLIYTGDLDKTIFPYRKVAVFNSKKNLNKQALYIDMKNFNKVNVNQYIEFQSSPFNKNTVEKFLNKNNIFLEKKGEQLYKLKFK
jgi:hypothetical protein